MIETSLPDPANIVETNRWLISQIIELRRERGARRVTAAEAARVLGYPEKHFHGKPWRIPCFGLSGMMHTLDEWKAWDDKPEVDRRAEWDAMDLKDRRRARGIPA